MKKLLKYFKPYRVVVAATLLLLFAETLGTLYMPTLTAEIVNRGVVAGDIPLIYRMGGRMLLVAAVTGIAAVGGTYCASMLSAKVARDIRNEMFSHAQRFSLHDFHNIGAASMITRTTADVNQIQQAVLMSLQMLLPVPIMVVAGLLLALSKDRWITGLIVAAALCFSVFAVLLGKRTIPLFRQLQDRLDTITRVARENITGVRVIRAFNKVDAERARGNQTFQAYAQTAIGINKIFALLMPVVMLIMNLCIVGIVWVGSHRVGAGAIEIGDIMALVEYGILILYFLVMGVSTFMIFPRAQACASRINEVLELEPEIVDATAPAPIAKGPARVEFQNVTFRYRGAEEPVLKKLSFSCAAGETTAIIGGTGSGKSTVANLIPRFYEIESGAILVNGVDIRALSQESLREQIGFVPQKAFLFRGTVTSNLRYGKPEATMEEIYHAAKIAQADDFIETLEGGYNAFVAQGGSNLSGGQKQRLSIARALVKRPEIYVFDDSFSALDFRTDAALRKALKQETRQAAVILVAQRISTIMDAERIVVLDDGEIAGVGTHRELLKSCGLYRQIAQSQLSEEELA